MWNRQEAVLSRIAMLATTTRMRRYACQPFRLLAPLLLASTFLAACGDGDDDPPSDAIEIKTLSNRADLISGGDALVEVVLPAGAAANTLRIDVDGRDVSAAFAARGGGSRDSSRDLSMAPTSLRHPPPVLDRRA